jgi:hypothetical protein
MVNLLLQTEQLMHFNDAQDLADTDAPIAGEAQLL